MKNHLCVLPRIAAFLLMPIVLAFTTPRLEAKAPKIRDIADTVAANPILTKFAAIIQGSDLATFLSSRGPFTLFVPTDAAFSKLPPDTVDILLRPENKVRLQDILLFHVVNGKKLTAKDLFLLKTVLSCQGTPLPLKTTHSGAQLVLKAKIVHADIRCKNGIIHEIDTVLMPPESVLPPLVVAPPPAPPKALPVSGTNTVSVVPLTTGTNTPSGETNATPATTPPATSTQAAAAATNAAAPATIVAPQ